MPRRSRHHHGDDGQLELFGPQPVLPLFAQEADVKAPLELGGEPAITRCFLGWDKALVQSVAEHLARGWHGRGALDLSDHLVLVPTRNASRRLREALAIHAARHDAAVLPPMTVTPDFLTSPAHLEDGNPAGGVETLLVWTAEMLRLDLDAFRHLFPVDPVERTFTWALKTAEDLLQLRETLNESGLSLADAARIMDGSEMEPERWRDLARLEKHCVKATEAGGFMDWQAARRSAAGSGILPQHIRRIVVAGVLDPSDLAVRALERHARHLPVEVLVFAPEASHRDFFERWGRPVADAWLTETIRIPSPEGAIHQGSIPAEQAAAAMELLRAYEHPGEVAAIGVADAEVTAPLEKSLAERGIGAYDPAGRPMARHGVFHLLRILSRLSGSRAFSAAAELIRCPDVAETIRRKCEEKAGSRPALAQLLNDLDHLAVKALPDTLDDAIELAQRTLKEDSPVLTALAWMNAMLEALAGRDFASALADFLADVFSARRFRSDRPQDAVFAAIADQIAEVLDALEGPASAWFSVPLPAGSRLELLLRVLEGQVFYAERAARDIDLQGWLELLWEDAPHLIVTGMNDGKVPDVILSHPFLPDAARRKLGLRHNDTRFARDACLMTCIIEFRRRTGGRVDFVFGRSGAGGEPLRPSRLLFQCPDAELPARTLLFFKKPPLRSDPVPWQLAWRLKAQPLPDDAPVFHKLSVTQFRDYLLCPFRFYLRHGLKMEEVDATRSEMDAMEFGSVLHHVLERFAAAAAAESADASVVRAELHRLLDAALHGTFGARLSVPLMIQRESARQRLAWWAGIEAAERAKGWRIIAAEARISPEDDPWMLGGILVTGIVDRVEQHERLGVRLIDFKTYSPSSAKGGERKSVEDYHLAKLTRTQDAAGFPQWMLTRNSKGEVARWTDLQLPLYRLAMERRHPAAKIHTAYATLGKTKADVALDAWPELEGWQLASARTCAEGIVNAIQSRAFWPPAEKLPFGDDYGHLFFGEPLEAVDPSRLATRNVA